MPSKPVFLVSDLHLGAVPPGTEEAFRRWLLHVKEAGSRLIINGDLFDFWFEYRRVVLSEHVRVLAVLADLVESGVPSSSWAATTTGGVATSSGSGSDSTSTRTRSGSG